MWLEAGPAVRRRAGWAASAVILTALLAVVWLSGQLVAGRGDPSLQCTRAEPDIAVAVLGPEPDEPWDTARGEFLVWPTGLVCDFTTGTSGRTTTRWYVTWPASAAAAVLGIALVGACCGLVAPDRTLRMLRRRKAD